MESLKILSPLSSVDSFDRCISQLWERNTQLRKDIEALQSDIIRLELEKARLTYECNSIRRYAEKWKQMEENHYRMAITLSTQMSSALKILCGTKVCSDGRSIADHMRDAHIKLGLLPEEPEQEGPQPNPNDEFYF